MLVRHGYGVPLFDRRGEGESEGEPNALGWDGEKDLRAALGFLRRQPDVDAHRVGGIGLSVGGELLLQAGVLRGRGAPRTIWKTDSGHTGGIEAAPREYERRVIAFFDRYLLARRVSVGRAAP